MKFRYIILFLVSLFFVVVDVQAQQKATPKEGEGVSSFLLRHNRRPSKYLDDFLKLNKGKIDKNLNLKKGVTYIIPGVKPDAPAKKSVQRSSATTRQTGGKATPISKAKPTSSRKGMVVKQPLFGKKLESVKVLSNQLVGTCFYLVSGHGGPDPGAMGKVGSHTLHEDEYAYDIILRLGRKLIEQGADVRIIIQDSQDGIREGAYLQNSKRETCMGSPIPLSQTARLRQRVGKINALFAKDKKQYKYCRAIFIHLDSRSKGKRIDTFFYYGRGKSVSKRLANNMCELFEAKYAKHQPNRGFTGTVSARNLFVLANTHPASVFVELGNIQNQMDQRRFLNVSNRDALAKWLMEGFIKDYKSGKK